MSLGGLHTEDAQERLVGLDQEEETQAVYPISGTRTFPYKAWVPFPLKAKGSPSKLCLPDLRSAALPPSPCLSGLAGCPGDSARLTVSQRSQKQQHQEKQKQLLQS